MRRCPINLKKPVDGLLQSLVRDDKGMFFIVVKNLGWLIRNWRIVEAFDVYQHPPVKQGMRPDVYLVARLRDGRTYETGYSDIGVMQDWLARSRTLRDVPIAYHGQTAKM